MATWMAWAILIALLVLVVMAILFAVGVLKVTQADAE